MPGGVPRLTSEKADRIEFQRSIAGGNSCKEVMAVRCSNRSRRQFSSRVVSVASISEMDIRCSSWFIPVIVSLDEALSLPIAAPTMLDGYPARADLGSNFIRAEAGAGGEGQVAELYGP